MQTLTHEMITKDATGIGLPMAEEEPPTVVAARHEGDVVLRDGSTVRVREMHLADDAALLALFQSLSEESRWLRFLSLASGAALAAEARRETNLDHTVGLLALSGPEERVVGHAFYAGIDEHRA